MMFESFSYQSMTVVARVFLLVISGCRSTQSTSSSSNSANQSNTPADGSAPLEIEIKVELRLDGRKGILTRKLTCPCSKLINETSPT
jgi:hypothetical protein